MHSLVGGGESSNQGRANIGMPKSVQQKVANIETKAKKLRHNNQKCENVLLQKKNEHTKKEINQGGLWWAWQWQLGTVLSN